LDERATQVRTLSPFVLDHTNTRGAPGAEPNCRTARGWTASVISHATTAVEHPDLVNGRVGRPVEAVGRESIIAANDCGFAQGPFYRRVHPSIVWAKLEALAEGARRASGEFWT